MGFIFNQGFIFTGNTGGSGGGSSQYLAVPGPFEAITIGNSYEIYFFSASSLDFIMEDGGYTSTVTSYSVGGAGFDEHAADASCTAAIAADAWTHTFLQDESMGLCEATRAAHITACLTLVGRCYSANPDVIVMLQQTPAYAAAHTAYPGTFANPDVMFGQIEDGYEAAQAACRIAHPTGRFPIIKWGLMLWAMGGNYATTNPDYVELHDPDNTHPTPDSQFLKTCARFFQITGLDPTPYAADLAAYYTSDLGGSLTLDPEDLATFAYRVQRYNAYPPTFPIHPVDTDIADGEVTFTASVRASPVATAQWYRDGVAIPGATDPDSVTITGLDEDDFNSEVYLIATNSEGSHQSATAVINPVETLMPFKLAFRHQGAGGYDAGTGHTFIPTGGDSLVASLIGTQFPIYDTTGALTPYTFEVLASVGGGSNSTGVAGAWGTPSSLTSNFWFGTLAGGALTYRINDLPEIALDVWLAGARGSTDSRSTIVQITGTAVKSVTWEAGATLPVDQPKITDITPASGGILGFSQGIGAGNNQGFHYNTIIDVRVHTP